MAIKYEFRPFRSLIRLNIASSKLGLRLKSLVLSEGVNIFNYLSIGLEIYCIIFFF